MTSGLVARAGLQAAYLVVLLRWLGVERYGLFAGSVAALMLLFPLAGWGMGNVFMERSAGDTEGRAGLWVRTGRQALATSALVAVAGLLGVGLALGIRLELAALAPLALAELVALPLAQFAATSLVATGRSGASAVAVCAVPAARLAGAVAVVAAGVAPSLQVLALTHCAGSLLAATLVLAVARHVIAAGSAGRGGARPGPRELVRDGAPYAAAALASQSYTELDKVFVLQMLGPGIAGTYTAAFRVVSVLVIPINALVSNSLPRLFEAERAGGAPHLIRKLVLAATAYGLLASLAAAAFAPFMPRVFGPEFAESSRFVWMLAAWMPLAALHLGGAAALVGAGGKRTRLAIETVGLAVVAALNLAWLPRLGASGAVAALLVAEAGMALACWISLRRRRAAIARA